MHRRTRARELAIQALYQLNVQGGDILPFLPGFFAENEPDTQTCELALQWTKKTWQNMTECDELIEVSAIRWHMSRLAHVDKSILRLAVCQLKFCRDIPPKVVINEAIELAKKFSTEKSPAFVNGILDAILRKLKNQNQS